MRKRLLFIAAVLLSLLSLAPPALAREAVPASADPELEKRVMGLAAELRCLVCQNQTIADSHAELAVDLRRQIGELIAKGQSDDQIRTYMTERYGDFVLYNPPFKPATLLLWFGPPLLLVGALAALIVSLRRRQRAAPEAFDPDSPDDVAVDGGPR